MGKKIAAVIAGIMIAFSTVMFIEWASHRLWPVAKNIDFNNAQQVKQMMAAMPLQSFISLLFGWTLAMFLGVFVARKISGLKANTTRAPALIVAGFFGLATSANFLLLPHPVWLIVLTALLLPASAWLALRLTNH